jgi:hypothetical protein
MSHGIIGMAADGTMQGGHYDAGYRPEEEQEKSERRDSTGA